MAKDNFNNSVFGVVLAITALIAIFAVGSFSGSATYERHGPTITVLEPAAGDTITESTTVLAQIDNEWRNMTLVSVDFYLVEPSGYDTLLGTVQSLDLRDEITTVRFSFDAKKYDNGDYYIKAVARDDSNNYYSGLTDGIIKLNYQKRTFEHH